MKTSNTIQGTILAIFGAILVIVLIFGNMHA